MEHKILSRSLIRFFLYLILGVGFVDTTHARKPRPKEGSASLTEEVRTFSEAKKYLRRHLDLFDHKTVYCSCQIKTQKKTKDQRQDQSLRIDLSSCGYKIQGPSSRAKRLEWEHVVPAEAFGQSFVEWRVGVPLCAKHGRKYKGRKCAEKNSEFSKMEADVYNLFPEIGELNGLRSNYSMAEISGRAGQFGDCAVKLEDRKFEPQDASKGIVARTYMNFDKRYPDRGVISGKNRLLFEAWDRMYPVTPLECRRWKALASVAGYPHLFISRCQDLAKEGF